ncbi:hypothetical protein BDV38DRAFT_97530 [Aspergillus pseudotamarii]|uniref:FAD-binding domain-containing protein n=1 Tax=Aspergillus pseudotamarii TaxID=132259 RepID=A0A5N6T9W5_ASPPS|nr:uncharacterized protein BDV38DRAFT_97530 [Aspergillus pseudotamarii]KAE8143057.1 hypothetical protein BDV38DRAFT_97530 [Aspergillus pseudotamarii]
MPRDILVVGAGIAGLASAIALSNELAPVVPGLKITVYDGARELTTSGGAISLTPVAQRYLDELGVLSELNQMGDHAGIEVDAIDLFSVRVGRRLGPLRFTDENGHGYGGYKGRRVLRSALSEAMLTVARRLPNVSVHYDKKLVRGNTTAENVTLQFEDGSTATGDLVLGGDGVHSATRTKIVDPGNRSEYTGISFIQSMADAQNFTATMPFTQTAVHLARHSSLLTSYCDPKHEKLFVAAIVRVSEHLIEKYQAMSGTDLAAQKNMRMSMRYLVRAQFGMSSLPYIREIIDRTEDWMLYPVYQVRQRGKWHTDRILLLGDAAHAMPPRDESAAYAVEDAIIFSKLLAQNPDCQLITLFEEYEELRRGLVNKAFDASRRLWQSDLDKGLFPGQTRDLMSPVHLPPDSHIGRRATQPINKTTLPAPTHESFSDLSVYSLTSDLGRTVDATNVD